MDPLSAARRLARAGNGTTCRSATPRPSAPSSTTRTPPSSGGPRIVRWRTGTVTAVDGASDEDVVNQIRRSPRHGTPAVDGPRAGRSARDRPRGGSARLRTVQALRGGRGSADLFRARVPARARRAWYRRRRSGAIVDTDPPGPFDGAGAVIRHQSPSLREMAATLMKVSQNLYAEVLFHALGAGVGEARRRAPRQSRPAARLGRRRHRRRGRRRLRAVPLRPRRRRRSTRCCRTCSRRPRIAIPGWLRCRSPAWTARSSAG